jgi:hypothetical protein
MQVSKQHFWWCTGVHLAVWGTVDADKHVDMTLAIPADTLRRVGLTRLPASTVLPIQVKGSIKRPDVDWLRCDMGTVPLMLTKILIERVFPSTSLWSAFGPVT